MFLPPQILPTTVTKEFQQSLNPNDVLAILKAGNARFSHNLHYVRDTASQRKNLTNAQSPIAVILGCIDSRAPSEMIFDIGLGVVFNIRIAGNILNDDILGSLEFATKVAGAKLIVVMGHSDCGAIKSACQKVRLGNITKIMEKIDPVIEKTGEGFANATMENLEFVDAVIKKNAEFVKQQIEDQSLIIKELVDLGEVKIISSVYNLETGKVTFEE